MKKERNLMIVLLLLAILYFGCFAVFSAFRTDWLCFALAFLSVYLFVKTYFFRSDSSLFLATFLLFLSMFLQKNISSVFSVTQIIALIILFVSISFLVDYCVFSNVFCFLAFFVNFLISIPNLLYAFHCINLFFLILSLCGENVLFIIILLLRKYGKI